MYELVIAYNAAALSFMLRVSERGAACSAVKQPLHICGRAKWPTFAGACIIGHTYFVRHCFLCVFFSFVPSFVNA